MRNPNDQQSNPTFGRIPCICRAKCLRMGYVWEGLTIYPTYYYSTHPTYSNYPTPYVFMLTPPFLYVPPPAYLYPYRPRYVYMPPMNHFPLNPLGEQSMSGFGLKPAFARKLLALPFTAFLANMARGVFATVSLNAHRSPKRSGAFRLTLSEVCS